jgi:hypothetical protein
MNKIVFVIAIAAAALAAYAAISVPAVVYAQILEKDNIPDIPLSGNVTTLGEIDLSVDFSEGLLPPNGTQTLSTAGITDIDITSLPGPGFTLILDNQTATVTVHPVEIVPDTSADDAPTAGGGEDTSGDDDDDEG